MHTKNALPSPALIGTNDGTDFDRTASWLAMLLSHVKASQGTRREEVTMFVLFENIFFFFFLLVYFFVQFQQTYQNLIKLNF